jgi:hypothetical protein
MERITLAAEQILGYCWRPRSVGFQPAASSGYAFVVMMDERKDDEAATCSDSISNR